MFFMTTEHHPFSKEIRKEIRKQIRKTIRKNLAAVALISLSLLHGTQVLAQQSPSAARPVSPASKSTVAPGTAGAALLAYQFKAGEKMHFKVSALFDGHFPPFAQPDSPPVHFKAVLGYTVTVLKVDGEGATVEFVVDSREMYLFKNEVAEEAKIDINSEDVAVLDGLTSLEDTQKALNATAILRTDGSVVRVLSNSSVKVPFDVGFDIRKLFLMMLPMTFPNHPIKVGDTWPATDGLLGSKAGKTEYSDRLDAVAPAGKGTAYRLSQSAKSVVEDRLDKTGASTTIDADVYRVLSGKVDLKTQTTFVVPGAPAVPVMPPKGTPADKGTTVKPDKVVPANPAPRIPVQAGTVKSVHLEMNAALNRKRIKIDPDQPEIPENDPLDVRARITITRGDSPAVAVANAAPGTGAVKPQPKTGEKPVEKK